MIIFVLCGLLSVTVAQYPYQSQAPHAGQAYRPQPQAYQPQPQAYQPQQPAYQPQPQAYQPQPQAYQPQPQQPAYHQPPPQQRSYAPAAVHYVNIGAELNGDYKFGYDTGKGNDGQSFREETRLPDGSVQGAYGYIDETGKQRIVKYTAGKDGFKAEGDVGPAGLPQASVPGPAPQPAANPHASQPAYLRQGPLANGYSGNSNNYIGNGY